MVKECSFPGCTKPAVAKGLCNSHWAQQARGHELTPIRTHETLEERIRRVIDIREDEPVACWEFKSSGSGRSRGYGQIWHNGSKGMAHRVAYEFFTGKKIPEGIQLDHLCRNKKCCNPNHLEPVDQNENMKRMRFARSTLWKLEKLESFLSAEGYDLDDIYGR